MNTGVQIAYLVEGDGALAEFARARVRDLKSAILVDTPEQASRQRVLIRISFDARAKPRKRCLKLSPTPSHLQVQGQKVFCVNLSMFAEEELQNPAILERCRNAFLEIYKLTRKRAHEVPRPSKRSEFGGQLPSKRLRQNARKIQEQREAVIA